MRRLKVLTSLSLLLSLSVMPPAMAEDRPGDPPQGWDVSVAQGGSHDVTVEVNHRTTSPGHTSSAHDSSDTTRINGLTTAEETAALAAARQRIIAQCNDLRRWVVDSIHHGTTPTPAELAATNRYTSMCITKPTGNTEADLAAPVNPPPNPVVLARRAVLSLDLPPATPLIEPDPRRNQWHIVAVGQPLWLDVADATRTVDTSTTIDGYPVTLHATRRPIRFDMGDGHTVTCTSTTRWTRQVDPDADSPTCGHRYLTRPADGKRTVTITTRWTVTWTTLGQSGTIPVSKTATTTLPVKELLSVNVRNP